MTTSAQTRQETRTVVPPVDIFETKDDFILVADLPGVLPEGLSVRMHGNELSIEGQRPTTDPGTVVERGYAQADYARTFRLPPGIDGNRIDAQLNDGVLTVKLPKSETVKPRRIEVRSAS